MKPAPFVYVRAESVEEAVAALGEHGGEARVLAGGQSLVPLMNLRLATPAVLVDVNGVAELAGLRVDGAIEIGAVTRQIAVERSPETGERAPLLAAALRHVAYPAVRSRGTVGGAVAHADPAGELPAVLVALGGEVVAQGPAGERTIAADDLFLTHFTTSLAADELITWVRLPARRPGERFGFHEVARKVGDFALAGAATAVETDGEVCRRARIVAFGVADRPVRLARAEEALAGRALGEEAILDAGRLAREEVEPRSDAHASGRARRQLLGTVVTRALREAAG